MIKYFSQAKFENEQVCMVVNQKGEQLCVYNEEMASYVRKQGDLSNIAHSKHFASESLSGTNAVNMYTGFMGYAGASFGCSSEFSGFDVSIFARAQVSTTMFMKEMSVIAASAELTKRPDELVNDNVHIKILNTVFINQQFIPEKIRKVLDLCFSETKSLLEKRYPNLFNYHFQIVIVFIPVTFNFNVALNMGVDFRYGMCIAKLEASTSIEPYVALAITGSASIGIPMAHVGFHLRATITYRFIPRLAFEKCNLCTSLQHRFDGIMFDVGMHIKLLTFQKEWNFFKTNTGASTKTLFQSCFGTAGYKPTKKDKPLVLETNKNDKTTPGFHNVKLVNNTKVVTQKELKKIAKKEGLNEWTKGVSDYKPLFGPDAAKIPLHGTEPMNATREGLEPPVVEQKEKVWSTEFLKEYVPQQALKTLNIEDLRRLPIQYFELGRVDREAIPPKVLLLPPKDMIEFIKRLPNDIKKNIRKLNLHESSYMLVWPEKVLNDRFPESIIKKVPVQYLYQLPEEFLQVRKIVLEEIPVETYKKGPANILGWICAKYKHLCFALKQSLKEDGTRIAPVVAVKSQETTQPAIVPIIPSTSSRISQTIDKIKNNTNTINSRTSEKIPQPLAVQSQSQEPKPVAKPTQSNQETNEEIPDEIPSELVSQSISSTTHNSNNHLPPVQENHIPTQRNDDTDLSHHDETDSSEQNNVKIAINVNLNQ